MSEEHEAIWRKLTELESTIETMAVAGEQIATAAVELQKKVEDYERRVARLERRNRRPA